MGLVHVSATKHSSVVSVGILTFLPDSHRRHDMYIQFTSMAAFPTHCFYPQHPVVQRSTVDLFLFVSIRTFRPLTEQSSLPILCLDLLDGTLEKEGQVRGSSKYTDDHAPRKTLICDEPSGLLPSLTHSRYSQPSFLPVSHGYLCTPSLAHG
ncbi:hypothetical protein DL93DRAFT_856744 [Clavulina sp. PMI_390]|nr:hypothetical protein DL93DRAFT_856744 [Clavulina sp. PMI_390]